MNNKPRFSAYEYFLADNFADNKTKWEPYQNNFALNFLLSYNENLDYMNQKLQYFHQNFDRLTTEEGDQMFLILNFIDLRGLIKFDSKKEKVFIDNAKIDATFFEVRDEQDLVEMNSALQTLEQDQHTSEQISGSLATLNADFNYLISFIKFRDTRRTFYLDYLTTPEYIDWNAAVTKSLFLNRNTLAR